MNKIRTYFALALTICLLGTLAACNPVPDEGDAGNEAVASSAPPASLPLAVTLGELLELVVAGDGEQPVKRWIAQEQPKSEAYGFIEYPPEYSAGHAYYWGDWITRADDYCAVRTLRDYTPAQIDFTLGWYADLSGRSVKQLEDEFLAEHERLGGQVEQNVSTSGEVIGDSYLIEAEECRAGLFKRDDLGDRLTVFGVMLKPVQLAVVSERNREFGDLLQFASEDQPATLAELVVSLAGSYSHLVAPATTSGKNTMPRVAALLDAMVISDISEVVDADTFVRPIYAGSAFATVQSKDPVMVITVRATGFDAAPATGGSAPIESVAAAGQHLVRVTLVADVEHEAVARRVEHVVDRGQELDGAEARGQMSAGARNALDDFVADFSGDLFRLLFRQLPEVRRPLNAR